jgi:hypothetical protein
MDTLSEDEELMAGQQIKSRNLAYRCIMQVTKDALPFSYNKMFNYFKTEQILNEMFSLRKVSITHAINFQNSVLIQYRKFC